MIRLNADIAYDELINTHNEKNRSVTLDLNGHILSTTIKNFITVELSEMTIPLKVAVMGCVVNGIGEGKEADVGIAGGGNGTGVLFVKGQEPVKVQGDLAEILIQKVREICGATRKDESI